MNTRHFLAATLTTAWAVPSLRGGAKSSATSIAAGDESQTSSRRSQIASTSEHLDPHRSGNGGNLSGGRPVAEVVQTFGLPGGRPVAEVVQTFGLPGGWLRLLAVGLGIAFVWLVVLPRMARLPVIREHIAAMEAGQIEVDAMFYTELNWQPPRSGSRGGFSLDID